MWGRKDKTEMPADAVKRPTPLKTAMREARIEAAERTGVVVDLRDAELARLELVNEALEPVFAEIAPEIDLFDRGMSHGETPRLWIDPVAHVTMGRDKRLYRFLHDGRFGRRVLAESHEIADIVRAVTAYVARRLVERERALDGDPGLLGRVSRDEAGYHRRRRFWRNFGVLALGFAIGVAVFFAAILIAAHRH